ncbi:hypothetical protein [Synechococcus sp. BIOS-E4-1]|uniref:hypothetical protein n=1 Tax=Synechococcus sp. BIOS-E4-1 TaxID=1400864 RepID=UPI0016448C03|nr:hypothetical protein [Synechococcus sp. BIOS-E4-1]
MGTKISNDQCDQRLWSSRRTSNYQVDLLRRGFRFDRSLYGWDWSFQKIESLAQGRGAFQALVTTLQALYVMVYDVKLVFLGIHLPAVRILRYVAID